MDYLVNASTSLVDPANSQVPAALASLTKGGLTAVTKSLAIEYASHGVRLNAVALGVIKTPMHDPASYEGMAALHPLGRLGEISDVVDGALYLERATFKGVPAYIGAQVVGAILGSLAIIGVLGKVAGKTLGLGVAAFHPGVGYSQATFAEFVGTFLLVFTVFGVIDRRAPAGWAGLAIGFVVFAAIIVVAPATSASINPARTLGPMIVLQGAGGSVAWSQIWAYFGGEFLGGLLAGLAYSAMAATRTKPAAELELTLREATTDAIR